MVGGARADRPEITDFDPGAGISRIFLPACQDGWKTVMAVYAHELAHRWIAERYGPVVRAYLQARRRQHALRSETDDALQDVFLNCFREEGAHERADSDPARLIFDFLRAKADRRSDGGLGR